jgi:hypothetical protein
MILRSRDLLEYLREERKRIAAAIAVLEQGPRVRIAISLQRCNVVSRPTRRRYYGPGREWTRKEHRILRELYPQQKPVGEIAALLNRTRQSVKSRAERLGLRRSNRKVWTAAEDDILRRRYATESSRALTEVFSCTFYQLYNRAFRLGLRKDSEFVKAQNRALGVKLTVAGFAHRFVKGLPPSNKGLRRPGWFAGRMRETQFKKGQWIWHQRKVGETRICDGYQYTKIAETPCVPWTRNWKMTHILIWEKAHGPIPARHAVCFKDGDRTHITLDNLELIHRRDLLRRNQAHISPELKQVIQLAGALKRQIRRRDGQKQDVGSPGSSLRDPGVAEGSGEALGR